MEATAWRATDRLSEYPEGQVSANANIILVGIVRSYPQYENIQTFLQERGGDITDVRFYLLNNRVRHSEDEETFASKSDIICLAAFTEDDTADDFEYLFSLTEDVAEAREIIPGQKNAMSLLRSSRMVKEAFDQNDSDAALMEDFLWAMRDKHKRDMTSETTFTVRYGWWRIEVCGKTYGPLRKAGVQALIQELRG